ncbi:MAG: WS/DGAT domain-containing protein, partial [Caldimonas sp.]
FGASINDTVLWLCSTALRNYLKEGNELPDASLVAGVPISLRAEGDTSMNNQVTGTVIDLGTQIGDPVQRLKAIMKGTAAMKKQMGTFRGVMPTDLPSLGAPWLMSGLASLYGRSRIADWLRLANVTISNVPGSKVPVYLVGARMVDYYPLSIVVHGVALNITVQSHVDQLCFGLIACRRAVPDVRDLATQMQRALETLRGLPLPEAVAPAQHPPALIEAHAAAARPKPRAPARRTPGVAKAAGRRGAAAPSAAPAKRTPKPATSPPASPRLRVVGTPKARKPRPVEAAR